MDKTDDLRAIFLEVSDEETLIERQVGGASKAPVEEHDAAIAAQVAESTMADGLEDAVDGFDTATASG